MALMNRHWKIGLATTVVFLIGFVAAVTTSSMVALYALGMTSVVVAFVLGTAWIITQRTFSREGDEASEWLGKGGVAKAQAAVESSETPVR